MSVRSATSQALLEAGDIEGLLALHKNIFGGLVMTTPTGTPPAPSDAPAATDPAGVWGPGVVPPTIPSGGPFPPGGLPAGTQYTPEQVQAMVEQARSQERQALHSRLAKVDTLEQQIAEEKRLREERETAEAQRVADAEAEAARIAEEARVANLTAVQRVEELDATWNARLQQVETERATERAINEREREFLLLDQYRTQQIAANQDAIAPEFLDYVQGNTREEIDASIAQAITKTDSIVAGTQAAQRFGMQTSRGSAPTGLPPAGGPLDTTSQQQSYTAEQIAAMGPAEYAKNRHLLLPAVSRQVHEQGLYGQR